MYNIREKTPEYLSKDILEENFVNIFLYIFRLQFLTGSSRVFVKKRFVRPPTPLQKCYTILCILVTLGSVNFVIPIFFGSFVKTVRGLSTSVVLTIFFTSLCNFVHVRFFNGRQNAEFYVKMQKLDRLMKIEKLTINSEVKRINAVSVFLMVIVFVFLIAVSCASQLFHALSFVFVMVSVLAFYLELLACSSIVVFFFIRVRFVNFLIESYLKQEENVRKPIVLDEVSLKWVKVVAQETENNFYTCDVHLHLKEIFRCFANFQYLYRFQLALFCISMVGLSLLAFEMTILTLKNGLYAPTQLSSHATFQIIDILIAICLAFRFEMFYSEVRETKRLCINVMALHQEGPLWEKARIMFKTIEETPPRFSVYNMWEMNAGIFVSIFTFVTSFMVTLIQFECL